MPITRRAWIKGLTSGAIGGATLLQGCSKSGSAGSRNANSADVSSPAAASAAVEASRVTDASADSLGFHAWASTPPMGWNSWDSFATTITEAQARENAQAMASKLLPHGYQFFTVDIQWYEPNAVGFDYRKDAPLTMDEWGRLLPAPNRFPSSAGGKGFTPLAEYVHGLGLKYGVHLMRGIPRQAVAQNVPIKGTNVRAADIANRNSVCPWNADMFGVDMTKPGAQEYYNSVFELLASWGVDFVKVDDMSRPYHEHEKEIEAVRKAIDRTGRPMVLSLSPGETPVDAAEHVRANANLWRISDDFWDTWPLLLEQFGRLERWNPHRGVGFWPDADMLPLGVLHMGERTTRFTQDEQLTLMTLWSIARSPLIMGGDLRKLDDFTLKLLTNDEVLAVNQHSTANRPVYSRDGIVVWMADAPRESPVGEQGGVAAGKRAPGSDGAVNTTHAVDKYLAVFNTRDRDAGGAAEGMPVQVAFSDLGLEGPRLVRDLWQKRTLGESRDTFTATLPWHGAGLYRLFAPMI